MNYSINIWKNNKILQVNIHSTYTEGLNMELLKHLKEINILLMAVFWVLAPCNLVEICLCFKGPCCLHQQSNE